jgi:hypothetical protein
MNREIDMPEEAQLDRITILTDNSIRVDLKFLDETWLTLDFAPSTDLAQRLLTLINDAVSDRLNDLTQRGLIVAEYSAPEVDDDEDDE